VKRVRDSGRTELADRLARIGSDVRISVVYQDAPPGLGHAIGCARSAVGNEPFAVLLPDELMGDSSLLKQMSDMFLQNGKSVVGLKQVPMTEVSAYGCVKTTSAPTASGEVTVTDVVEKPAMHCTKWRNSIDRCITDRGASGRFVWCREQHCPI